MSSVGIQLSSELAFATHAGLWEMPFKNCPSLSVPHKVLVLQASAFTWFVVQTRSGDLTPYSIRHIVKPMTTLPEEHMQQQLLSLAETVKDDYGRMDLSSMWRPYCRCVHATKAT